MITDEGLETRLEQVTWHEFVFDGQETSVLAGLKDLGHDLKEGTHCYWTLPNSGKPNMDMHADDETLILIKNADKAKGTAQLQLVDLSRDPHGTVIATARDCGVQFDLQELFEGSDAGVLEVWDLELPGYAQGSTRSHLD